MNCQRDIPPNKGEFFMEVFVCPDCKCVAERVYERSQQDVKHLLLLMKEVIRMALMEGRLQFQDPKQVEEVSRSDLISRLAELAEKVRKKGRERSCKETQQESTEPTKPHVATLAAIGRQSSSKPNLAD